MLLNARERIVAVDATKFDQIGFSKVCKLEEVDQIVTDREPEERWLTGLEEKGVACVYGEEEQRYSVCQ